jgi:hypothetical protein
VVSGRIVRLDGDEHDFVQLLLPWIDSGCLDSAESARVNAHLIHCPRCRTDVAWRRGVRKASPGPRPPAGIVHSQAAVEPAWPTLRGPTGSRGRAEPRRAMVTPATTRISRAGACWWRWVLALQSAVIAGLVVLVVGLLPRDGPQRAPGGGVQPGAASVAVVFKPDANEQQIREALRDSDARVVDGPTSTGAYLVGVAPASQVAAIEQLRRNGSVLRVESLDAGPPR